MKAHCCVLTLFFTGCATAAASAPPPGASGGPEALELATELAQLQIPPGAYKQEILAGLTAAAAASPGHTTGMAGVSDELVAQMVLEILPDRFLVETKARLDASHYTVDELRAMLRWFRSDLGKKSIAVGAQMASEEATAILERYQRELPAAQLRMARRLATDATVGPGGLNWAARELATSKDATPDDLLAAKTAATKAVGAEPERPGFVDTLATVEFRLGELDQAVERESAVFATRQDDRAVASQLARFEWARLNKSGPKIDGGDVETSGIRLEPTLPSAGTFGPAHFLLTVGQSLPKGGQIDALFVSEGKPIGIVRFNLGPNHPATKDFTMTIGAGIRLLPELKKEGLPADTKLVLSRINTGWAAKPGVIQWHGKWMDAGVARLP